MTVYKSKDILCRSEGNLPRFFPKPLQGFSSSHGGFGGLGFQQETCLVGQSLGGSEGWTEASRFDLAGCAGWFGEISAVWWFSWMVHLKKTERVTLVFCAKCQISVGKRHKWSAIWKEMKPENCLLLWRALCTRSSSTTGGWTHQRPLRRALREIPKQFPNHRNPQVAIYGGVNAKPSIFMFWMLLQTLPVPIFIFLKPNRWSWRWPLPWVPWRETHKAATCWEWQDVLEKSLARLHDQWGNLQSFTRPYPTASIKCRTWLHEVWPCMALRALRMTILSLPWWAQKRRRKKRRHSEPWEERKGSSALNPLNRKLYLIDEATSSQAMPLLRSYYRGKNI